jgi:hypothetical protein
MLTQGERNRLVAKLAEYTAAWEHYVHEMYVEAPARFGAGARVSDLKDELRKLIDEELS